MTDNPFDLDYRESAAELDDFAEVLAADAPTTTGPTYHGDLLQGSDEWLQTRCGLLTASEMKLII
ncbi:MAG: hypothetical protein B7Z20_10575, partial [Sphingobium sp. 32-64-5]